MRRSFLLAVLLALVLALWLGPAAAAATYAPSECVECHTLRNPGIVTQFQRATMSGAGVTCVSCHGADHALIDAAQGSVPASTCAQDGCHPDQYAEFTLKDAAGSYINKHAQGWTRMVASARYKVMPDIQRYEMCERCHNIGYVSGDARRRLFAPN